MSSVDLDEIRARHKEGGRGNCYWCTCAYPCDAIQLCDEVERLGKDNEELMDIVDAEVGKFVSSCGKVDRLLEALEFYAEKENWEYHGSGVTSAVNDNGKVARAALNGG